MPRRYLTPSEMESAIARGKSVECFLGACEKGAQKGIKWLLAFRDGEGVCLKVFETADYGDKDFIDLYEFGPLNSALEQDEPDEEEMFESFNSLISEVEVKFPGSSTRFVNEGVVQDEYSDFIDRGRK